MIDRSVVRIRWLHILTLLTGGLIAVWLFRASVLNHGQALAQANKQYQTIQDLAPERGKIFVASSPYDSEEPFPLATNKEKFQILVVPKNVKDSRKVADTLGEILGLDKEQIFSQINNQKLYVPPIARRQESEIAQKIINQKLDGVLAAPEQVRFYPEAGLASQVVGFVDFENQGRYGLEGAYDEVLQGLAGKVVAKKDSKGRFISVSESSPARHGDDLFLTLDQNVQFKAEQLLNEGIGKYAAEKGQMIVMDAPTGGIIAMAATDGFDPNTFNTVKQQEQWRFLNPNVSLAWEPGSVFKPIIVALGLDVGKVKPDDSGDFSNSVVVQGYEIHTAQDKAFGRENITQILENSDNVAMVWVADKIGSEILHKYLTNFGFGVKTGVDLSGEATGTLRKLSQWRDIHRATVGFGQGITVTPLQLTSAYAALANGGKLMAPRLVKKIIRQPSGETVEIQPKEIRQIISPETAAAARQMLIAVVENGHGKKARVAGYKIGGKTGTAQIAKAEGGYEENAHIGSFVGLVPGDKPRFVVLAKFDRPKNVEFAESSAAPTVGEMAKFLLGYYKIPPTEPTQ